MCGIAGIVHSDRRQAVDEESLRRMNAAMAHRGPDNAHVWLGSGAGIAARRLSIRDLGHGRQPMVNEAGTLVAALNGEIYNDAELRRELESKGYRFRTDCDTETVLRAFEAYGDAALEKLNGMFALAVFDVTQDRLLLARDRLGIKPLYYSELGDRLLFASELDALMQSGQVSDTISSSAIDAYFTYMYVPAPDCIYGGVKKLRPGEFLTYARGQVARHEYWRPERGRPEYGPDTKWTLESAAEALRAQVRQSVRMQCVSDVPVGAFLSGGMDSSAIVAAMAEQSAGPVKTFSIGFDDAVANELPYARAVAERFGTEHTELVVRPDSVALVPRLAAHFGEPFADSSAVPTWMVSELAGRDVKVVLSGDGGDELFAGYTWTRMNRLVGRLRGIPRPLRSMLLRAWAGLPRSSRGDKVRRALADTLLDHQESFRRRSSTLTASERGGLYDGGFRQRLEGDKVDRFAEHAASLAQWPEDDWMLAQDLRMYLPDDVLTKVDRMSMAHGLEVRVPLLDHRLVEFAFTLPFELKLRGGVSKRVMKHAFRDVLPPSILGQRKRGFAVPIDRWFRDDLVELYRDTVCAPDARCLGFLDRARVTAMMDSHASGREGLGHRLWSVLMFETWLRYRGDVEARSRRSSSSLNDAPFHKRSA